MPKKRLTEEAVKRIQPPASGKQVDYYDAGMPGLILRMIESTISACRLP